VSYHSIKHYLTGLEAEFADELKKRSDGRIVCDYYGAETLVKSKEIFESVSTGRVQMGETCAGYCEGEIPLLGMPSLPGVRTTAEAWYEAMEKGGIDIHQPFFQDYGMKLLHYIDVGGYYLYNSARPVYTLEDLKGLKLKVAGKVPFDYMTLAGASPMAMPAPELAIALERGTLDGMLLPPFGVPVWSCLDLVDYATKFAFGSGTLITLVNLDWWQELPEDVRQLILETSQEINSERGQEGAIKENTAAWDEMKAHGVEILELTPAQIKAFNDVGQPVLDKALKDWGPAGVELYELAKKYNK